MIHVLSNGQLSFVSDSRGAEPVSLSFEGEDINYLWHSAEDGSPLTSICFPLIGGVPDGVYTLEGKEYHMPAHGFGQFQDFTVAEISGSSVMYELADNVDTRRIFPWRFKLQVRYSLEGQSLAIEYRILNRDDRALYCSAGGHIRFACPIGNEGFSFADYSLDFGMPVTSTDIVKSYGPVETIEKSLVDGGRSLRLNYSLFESGCFCLRPLPLATCVLSDGRSGRAVILRTGNASYFQVWTAPGAPYIALEPLYGSISSLPLRDEDGDWAARQGSLCIEPDKEISCAYSAIIYKDMEAER